MPTKISQLPDYNTLTASAFIPIIDNSLNKKISVSDLRKVFYLKTGTTGNTSSFSRHTPGLYYFGDNSDGAGNFSGSITTLRTRISASFTSTQDGVPVIKNFSSLFISRSVVISPTNRCRGMLIFVDGDAIISGSISMTARGAKFTGSEASFRALNPPYLGDYWSTQVFPSSSYLSRVFAVGASGGPSPSVAGSTGVLGRSGGGGAGGLGQVGGGALGAAGTSFSGGAGGAGHPGPSTTNGAGAAFGGAGGSSNATGPGSAGGGGAGNPGGTGGPTGGGNGTGGLLILIVRGNLKIGPNGSITVNGAAGASSTPNGPTGGGGGSGGGISYIYYGGTLTNNGTVTSNGGSGGSGAAGGGSGGAGGAGTAIISKLNTAFSVAN